MNLLIGALVALVWLAVTGAVLGWQDPELRVEPATDDGPVSIATPDGRLAVLSIGDPRPLSTGLVAWQQVRDMYALPESVLHEFARWLVSEGVDPLSLNYSGMLVHARKWLGLTEEQLMALHDELEGRKRR